ncbi:MAG TPA: SIMPL domain-containing protein [Humisphaera sp.]
MRRLAATLAAAALGITAVAAAPAPAAGQVQQQEQAQKASISTSGDAVIYVKPDEVALTFGVESFDAKLDKAKADNEAAAAKLIKAVKEVGVAEKDIQTDQLQVEVRYADSSHPVRGVEGYIARRGYCATLRDVKLVDKLVDAVLKNGANQLGGLDFRTTQLRKFRDQARKMAIKAAREKADLLAGELGVQVGAPRTITEGAIYSGYFGNRNFNANAMAQNAAVAAPGGDGEGGEATPLGQIAVHASVSVQFDLK